jgi:sensor histidine kinase YesM
MRRKSVSGHKPRSLLAEALAVAVVIFLVPSALSFFYFSRTVPTRMALQAENTAGFYISQLTGTVSESIQLTRDVAFNALADGALREYMQTPARSMAAGAQNALQSSVGSTVAFQSVWSDHFLSSVYLFRDDGPFTFYSPRGSYVQEQRRMQHVYEEAGDFSSARTFYRPPDGEAGKAYFVLDYKNIDTLQHVGKILIELNTDVLLNSDELMALYPGTCLALRDGDAVLYTQGEDCAKLLEGGGSREYYHVSRPIGSYSLQLDIFFPNAAIYRSAQETSRLYLTFCITTLLATLVVGGLAYYALLRPLRDMEKVLDRLAGSDYTARLPRSDYRELQQLERTFNRMADNLDASFRDAYQKGIQLQESESRLLAAQINPHFVFNVLETINMRCVDAGLKDISRMVTDLAQLLRGNIGLGSVSQQKITFEQELTYVRYYLELQRSRFGQGLEYSVEYEDEEILHYLLPRLSIQPLVENAVVHGLEPRRGLGRVGVRIWEEDASVYVRVEDDGVGFTPSEVDLSENAQAAHNHIALPNIRQRLRLFYGDRASLHVTSQPGQGTTVTLILPIDQKEK